jgi:hypothetical protein
MKELQIIKENYNDIKFIFDFYDRFAFKLAKVSLKEKSENTLVFLDYFNNESYYVLVKDVNIILDYCYNEYFFKIVLSGSLYYQKVKKVCDDLEISYQIYDLFFRSFFLAIKDRFFCKNHNGYQCNKDIVLRIVLKAHSEAFDNLPRIDQNEYQTKAKLILSKLEELKLVCYNQNDITNNIRLQSYFPISCDTFKFAITKETKNFDKSIPMLDFLDLRRYLDNSEVLNHNLLARMDRAIHNIVVVSFEDAKFYNNPYSDNSYIKKLRSDRERLNFENK